MTISEANIRFKNTITLLKTNEVWTPTNSWLKVLESNKTVTFSFVALTIDVDKVSLC